MAKNGGETTAEHGYAPADPNASKPSARERVEVRVDMPAGDDPHPHATIASRDGSIHVRMPADYVGKRMRPGERRAYFVGYVRTHGSLEIHDRLEGRSW